MTDYKELIERLRRKANLTEHVHVAREFRAAADAIEKLSAETEPLTYDEKIIFLSAMGREMKVCEEVDRKCLREPYEDSLVRVCREIKKKVKGALWT